MKKIYTLALLVIGGAFALNAQSSIEITHKGNTVTSGTTLFISTTVGTEDIYEFNIRNTSGSTKSYRMRRFDDVLHSGSEAYFCMQQCYSPGTITSPTALSLSPNQDAKSTGVNPSLHFIDHTSTGTSSIRYRIYDENNSADEFFLTLKYNDPLSVKSNQAFLTSVSEVYPNPCTTKASISVISQAETGIVKLEIFNSLGAMVSSKPLQLNAGKTTINIDPENLTSGIYFIVLRQGATLTTRKMTLSN